MIFTLIKYAQKDTTVWRQTRTTATVTTFVPIEFNFIVRMANNSS